MQPPNLLIAGFLFSPSSISRRSEIPQYMSFLVPCLLNFAQPVNASTTKPPWSLVLPCSHVSSTSDEKHQPVPNLIIKGNDQQRMLPPDPIHHVRKKRNEREKGCVRRKQHASLFHPGQTPNACICSHPTCQRGRPPFLSVPYNLHPPAQPLPTPSQWVGSITHSCQSTLLFPLLIS